MEKVNNLEMALDMLEYSKEGARNARRNIEEYAELMHKLPNKAFWEYMIRTEAARRDAYLADIEYWQSSVCFWETH